MEFPPPPGHVIAPPVPGPESQRDVQRLLGRCLLRLQQYERLIKAIIAHHELAGPAPELPAILESRIQDAANKTLGHLIGKFLENVVSQEGGERDLLGDDAPADVISFGFRLSIQLSAQDLAKTSDGLKELVVLRNTLVHHFIERFDLWQADGCAAASIYLQDCYSRIDGHYEELRAWAAHMETSRQARSTGARHVVSGFCATRSKDTRSRAGRRSRWSCPGWHSIMPIRHQPGTDAAAGFRS